MQILIDIDDALGEALDAVVRRRRLSGKREYIRQLIKGAILTEDVEMGARMEEGELRIVRHFLQVDLFEDLKFLGPKDAQPTKRQLAAAILVYGDKDGRLPDEVHMFRMKGKNSWDFSAISLDILDYCLCHLLPKRLRDKLCEWSVATTGKANNTGTILLQYLSALYRAPKSDRIGDDVAEEFKSNETDASAEEAFNRTTR